jgi:hemerythrin
MSTAADPTLPLHWHDGLLLGYAPMDAVHQAFVDDVAAVQTAPDEHLPALMAKLIAHAQEHFAEEDQWMEQTQFPPRDCHIQEHAAVMKSMLEVQALLDQGHTAICRDLADELARWFPGHADYLDSALAAWMCKQRHGGKPVVLRPALARQLATGSS